MGPVSPIDLILEVKTEGRSDEYDLITEALSSEIDPSTVRPVDELETILDELETALRERESSLEPY